jgi:hypothetical protein
MMARAGSWNDELLAYLRRLRGHARAAVVSNATLHVTSADTTTEIERFRAVRGRALPGPGGWAVAMQDLRLVGVPGGGGAVGVQDQGPAPPVDHHLVVEPTQ